MTPIVRIFISSPSDVVEEREAARQVVAKLQRFYRDGVELRPVLWEDLPLQADSSFQEGIDFVLHGKHQIDIAIFILWSRLGSPIGGPLRRSDGSPYNSGTEREFDLMLAARQQTGGERPQIVVYRRHDDAGFKKLLVGHPVDELKELVNQRTLLDSFIKQRFQDEQGHNIRAIHSYSNSSSFARRLKVHLRELLDEWPNQAGGRAGMRTHRFRRLRARLVQGVVLISALVATMLTTAWYMGRDFGTLVINTDPPAATISVAGQEWGKTPYSKFVPAGVWDLQIQKESFLTQNSEVTVARSQRVKREFTLVRADSPGTRVYKSFSAVAATLTQQAGEVKVLRAGSTQWVPGVLNMTLHPGDQIRTGVNSRAEITLKDGSMTRIGALTDFHLSSETSDTSTFTPVKRGLRYFFGPDRSKQFQIITPPVTTAPRG